MLEFHNNQNNVGKKNNEGNLESLCLKFRIQTNIADDEAPYNCRDMFPQWFLTGRHTIFIGSSLECHRT